MRFLGIDPGYATIGFGLVEKDQSVYKVGTYGVINTLPNQPLANRLLQIYTELGFIFHTVNPSGLAIEQLFFAKNTKTALAVSQARGVILLAARQAGLPVYEYTPLQVKQALTGYGRAEKYQIQAMTKRLLQLEKLPKPDDVADALAIALCAAQSYRSPFSYLG